MTQISEMGKCKVQKEESVDILHSIAINVMILLTICFLVVFILSNDVCLAPIWCIDRTGA